MNIHGGSRAPVVPATYHRGMSTPNMTAQPVQHLEPVSDDKNLLAPAEASSCCGGSNCC